MQGEQEIRVALLQLLQSLTLILEESESELSIQLRVVELRSLEAAVVVVLDEVVIWIARKAERIKAKRIHPWQLEKTQVWIGSCEVHGVEVDQVVAEQVLGAIGELI